MVDVRVRELTPAGRGAVSVVLVEGRGALGLVARVFSVPKLARDRMCLARLEVAGIALDEALLVVPRDERVELHLHGNPLLVGGVIQALAEAGAGAAERDVTNVGAARERLASALSEDGARILLDQAEGALRRELDRLLSIEGTSDLRSGVEELLERSRVADFASRPRVVVLAGPVNAGKSTLFNVLTGTERVVAAAQEGTTRDAIRELAVLGSYPIEVVDTAGTRELAADDDGARLERLAQARARAWRLRADLVLLLEPAGVERAPTAEAEEPDGLIVRIASRIDALPATRRPEPGISALHEPGAARRQVERAYREVFGLPPRAWESGRGVLLVEAMRSSVEQGLSASDALLCERLRAIRHDEPLAVDGSVEPS